MTHGKLDQLYQRFWDQYEKALPDRLILYPTKGYPFNVKPLSDSEFVISMAVDIKHLRYHTGSRKANLAIQIRGTKKCAYTNDGGAILTYSKVTLYYHKSEERRARDSLTFIESLHYDYEINNTSLRNHPVYHCQFGDCKKEPFFGRIDFELNISERNTHHHQVRIPTANMDMISVLLSIAADHLSSEEFKKVRDVYDKGKWHTLLPHISHHRMFSPGKCYRSRAWYIG